MLGTTLARRTIAACAALAMMPAVLTALPAEAEATTIRISTPAAPGDWHAEMLYIFKEWLERSTHGAFDVEVHLSGTLFQQGTEPVAMQRGNLEMALISAQDIAKQIPEWSVFTAGYLIRDPEHQQAVFSSELGQEFLGRVKEEMSIKILGVAYLGTRQLNLRDVREVRTPDDLAGVKLRMPGADTWIFLGEALGADPTPMAFTEVYLGLQTGTIDGQDNPLPTNRAARFYEVTSQIVLTSHLVDGVFVALAGQVWDALDEGQQARVQSAADAAIRFNNENRIREEEELVAFFESEGLTITEPDLDAFRSHVQALYLDSPFSADWSEGLIDRINAVE
jgi:TRAP-type transport system periplasmic protein